MNPQENPNMAQTVNNSPHIPVLRLFRNGQLVLHQVPSSQPIYQQQVYPQQQEIKVVQMPGGSFQIIQDISERNVEFLQTEQIVQQPQIQCAESNVMLDLQQQQQLQTQIQEWQPIQQQQATSNVQQEPMEIDDTCQSQETAVHEPHHQQVASDQLHLFQIHNISTQKPQHLQHMEQQQQMTPQPQQMQVVQYVQNIQAYETPTTHINVLNAHSLMTANTITSCAQVEHQIQRNPPPLHAFATPNVRQTLSPRIMTTSPARLPQKISIDEYRNRQSTPRRPYQKRGTRGIRGQMSIYRGSYRMPSQRDGSQTFNANNVSVQQFTPPSRGRGTYGRSLGVERTLVKPSGETEQQVVVMVRSSGNGSDVANMPLSAVVLDNKNPVIANLQTSTASTIKILNSAKTPENQGLTLQQAGSPTSGKVITMLPINKSTPTLLLNSKASNSPTRLTPTLSKQSPTLTPHKVSVNTVSSTTACPSSAQSPTLGLVVQKPQTPPPPPPPVREEIRLKPGLLAVCSHCGYTSKFFNRCQRCNKVLPEDCRSVPDDGTLKASPQVSKSAKTKEITTEKFYPNNTTHVTTPTTFVQVKRGRLPTVRKKKIPDEPEILTISDDDETSSASHPNTPNAGEIKKKAPKPNVNDPNSHIDRDLYQAIKLKEPDMDNLSVEDADEDLYSSAPETSLERYLDGSQINSLSNFTQLNCRTVRIGSYKAVPLEPVLVCDEGIRICVPYPGTEPLELRKKVVFEIALHNFVNVLVHFGRSMPVLFFYPKTNVGKSGRDLLGMNDENMEPYFHPLSADETHKRITLLPEKMTEDAKLNLKRIFHAQLVELESKEANAILVKASPKDTQNQHGRTSRSTTLILPPVKTKPETQDLLVYPPPPLKGGIPLNTDDYACLGEDQFLNDAIIDFYLKYLLQSKLSEEDQARTHVFSSYFYKRLTTKHLSRKPPADTQQTTLTPSEVRHSRVKSWTKKVNIFEKDFIIIPINEHAHWFLAIICFPGMKGCVRMSDGTPIESQPRPNPKLPKIKKLVEKQLAKLSSVTDLTGVKSIMIGSTTITLSKSTISYVGNKIPNIAAQPVVALDSDDSDRDEADGDEEELVNSEEEESDAMEEQQNSSLSVDQQAEDGTVNANDSASTVPEEDNVDGISGDQSVPENSSIDMDDSDPYAPIEGATIIEAPETENMTSCSTGPLEVSMETCESSTNIEVNETISDPLAQTVLDPSTIAGPLGPVISNPSEPLTGIEVTNSKETSPELNGEQPVNETQKGPTLNESEREAIKQPCILIFDSLCGSGRGRVVATLRDYLRIEHRHKVGCDRDFGKDDLRGAIPKVPQQNNFTDCGVYMLQYVESFFETPIQDFTLPIRSLPNWFPDELVRGKRESIANLIKQLMVEQKVTNVKLPDIIFPVITEDSSENKVDEPEAGENLTEETSCVAEPSDCAAEAQLSGDNAEVASDPNVVQENCVIQSDVVDTVPPELLVDPSASEICDGKDSSEVFFDIAEADKIIKEVSCKRENQDSNISCEQLPKKICVENQ